MNNQNYYGGNYGYNMYGGYTNPGVRYNTVRPPKITQPLTQADMEELRRTSGGFNMQVEPLEMKAAICTHKDQNGNIVLMENPDGSSTCAICGKTFNLVAADTESIQKSVNEILDVLQSVKTYYLEIPENYVKGYFAMIPYLEKLPAFYKVAVDNFNRYEAVPVNQNYSASGFDIYNSLGTNPYNPYTASPYGNGMMPGAPGMAQPYVNQPVYDNVGTQYAQPQAQPYQAAPYGANPFGAMDPAQPVVGYAQPATGMQQISQQQVQQQVNVQQAAAAQQAQATATQPVAQEAQATAEAQPTVTTTTFNV